MVSESRRDLSGLDNTVRWGLASLSLGAAFIHLGTMSEHFDFAVAHGTFFAVAAWLQLAFGILLILRPTRALLLTIVAVNAAIVAVWIMTRTVCAPFGNPSWDAEAVGFPDLLATIFEFLTLVGCLAVLAGKLEVRKLAPAVTLPALGAVGATVMILSTISLVPAIGGDAHGHHTDGDGVAAATDDHGHDTAASSGGGGAAPIEDATTGGIETANGESPCELSGPPVSEGQSSHGHRGPTPVLAIDDPDVRKQLGDELALAREVALSFPTAADAKNAGYIRITPYVACIGAHWIKPALMDDKFDVMAPEMLLYDTSGLDGRMVGLSYWAATGKGNPPDGFAGPNDVWHQHIGLCVGSQGVVGAEDTTEEECKRRGGQKTDGSNAWMVHAWVVPGWESAWGLFSGEHPELGKTVEHPST